MADQIGQLGLAVEGSDAERRIEIEPENVDAVRLFLRMQTQWEIETVTVGRTALIIHTGLRYTSLPVLAAALGIEVNTTVMDQLGIMERESLRIHDVRLQRARNGQ